jgi:RHS repeat-associated protein
LFFQGRELDPVTGLYDFRARWYDPRLGRFLSPDPLGYVDSPNLYQAFLGNPVNVRDPMGTYGLKCTPEGCTQMSDAAEWAILDAAGAPDSYKYSVVQQYSQEWDTVRGRAALMLSGYMAEAGLRQAGKMWLVGAGAAATGGLAAAGLTAAGVTTTTWGGTLLLGAGSGAVAGLGAQGTSDLIDGQLSSPSAYLWSAGTGAALGGAFSAAARGLASPGGAPLDLSSVEWGPRPIAIGARLPVLNPHFEPTPAMATEILAARTAAENARLAANPALAETVLSPAEYAAGQVNARVAPMAYGNALERMTAIRIRNSPLDSRVLVHVGGPNNPDFIGLGPVAGSNFDITTPGQVRAHLRRPGYGPGLNVITYQRPPGFRVLP